MRSMHDENCNRSYDEEKNNLVTFLQALKLHYLEIESYFTNRNDITSNHKRS